MCKLNEEIKKFLNSEDIKPLFINKRIYTLKNKDFALKILNMFATSYLGTDKYNEAITKENFTEKELCSIIIIESLNIVRYNNNYQQALKSHINPELYCYLKEGRRKMACIKGIGLSNIFTDNSLKVDCKNFENKIFEFEYNKNYIYLNNLNPEIYEEIYHKFISKGKEFLKRNNFDLNNDTAIKEDFKKLCNTLSDFCIKHKNYHIKIEINKTN